MYTALNNILETLNFFFLTFSLAVPLGNIMPRTLVMPAKKGGKERREG